MMNENVQRKKLLNHTDSKQATGAKGTRHGTFRQEHGDTIYETPDGTRYRMLPDGSWIFVSEKH